MMTQVGFDSRVRCYLAAAAASTTRICCALHQGAIFLRQRNLLRATLSGQIIVNVVKECVWDVLKSHGLRAWWTPREVSGAHVACAVCIVVKDGR